MSCDLFYYLNKNSFQFVSSSSKPCGKMFAKNLFILLTTIVVNINVIYCVTCNFRELSGSSGYACLLQSQSIQSDDDMNIVHGSHVDGYTDANVTYLGAEYSNITIFPSLLIDHFPSLSFIDLSGVNMKYFTRPITYCDMLYSMYLNKNEIRTFSGGIFKNCANLRAIHMEENGLRFIDSMAFAGTNLTTLYLQNNQIEFLQPDTFAHIPYLETLFLSDNLIEEVLPGTFDSTPNLLSVILSRNKLSSWSSHNLPNVYILYLDGNEITTISGAAFVDMPKVFLLDLGDNSITDLPTFEGLGQVTWLNFMNNKVKHVHAESFTNLVSLNYLYLGYNEIEYCNFTISDTDFLPNVRELSFSGNQLTAIENFILPVNVTNINFSYNKLTHLRVNSIKPITQLRYLNVENNEIRGIDRDFFANVTDLTMYMKNNHCYSDNITISGRDDYNQKESMLEGCFNNATNSISSVVVLVFSVLISVIFKF